jgi:PAS domain-containing protein
LGYAGIATLWIAFSDAVVTGLNLPTAVMTMKGAAFVFVTAALLYFTTRRLVQAVQQSAQALREQADLLNLTHDTVLVMNMAGVIQYWNRGAEEQYGWSAEQAVGRVVYDLLWSLAQLVA